MIKNITVPHDVVANIQQLNVEVESRKELLAFMISHNFDITTESFINYQNEYANYYAKFDAAKVAFEREYVRTTIENPISWDLNYRTCEAMITY